MPPNTNNAVQQWAASTLADAARAMVTSGIVAPGDIVTGLSSPLLFGMNGRWRSNQFLRLAGGARGGDAGYPLKAGTKIVQLQVQAATANPAATPVILVVNGVDDPTPIVLPAGQTSATVSLSITVEDTSKIAVRSAGVGPSGPVDPVVSVWTTESEEQP